MSSTRDLLEITPALIGYIDTSGVYRRMSRAYELWCGIRREEWLNRHVSEVVTRCFGEEYARHALPKLQRALCGESIAFEGWQEAGGQRRRVAVTYTPDREPDGSILGVLVMVTDLNALEHAEKRAALSEERLQLAAEFTNMGVWERDIASGELRWNSASFRVMGFDESDSAPRLDEIYAQMHPEDQPRHKVALAAAAVTGETFEVEYRMKGLDGQWNWIHSRGRFQFDSNGQPERVLGVNFDISREKRTAEHLARQNRLIDSILESTTDGIFMLDREWRFTYVNSRAASAMIPCKDLLGRTIWEVFPQAAQSQFGEHYPHTMNEGVPTHFEEYYPAPLNRWFEVHAYPTETGLVGFFRDVTARREGRETLRLRDQAVTDAPVGITIAQFNSETDYPLVYVNPAFERLTGYSSEEILGKNCRFLQGPATSPTVRAQIHQAVVSGAGGRFVLRNYRKDGTEFFNELRLSPVRDEEGRVTHLVGIQTDITERVEIRKRLTQQAQTDALTGLPNRYYFLESLRHALRQVSREDSQQLAVIYLDVDGFKRVNERLGHQGGDRFLKKIGSRIRASIRGDELVARLGGDEFVILVTNITDRLALERLVQRVLARIAGPMQVSGRDMVVTASAGFACAPEDATDAEDLLRKADLAMFTAKRDCKNSWKAYKPSMEMSNANFLEIAAGVRDALKRNEFRLVYQPRIDARTGRLRAMEALIRWHHPERGLLGPANFIPVAEETGLILQVGDWVVQETARQLAEWRQAGYHLVPVSVNVSAAQFRNPDFPDAVATVLQDAGIGPDLLEMEITESVIMDETLSSEALSRLRKLGIRIAIDDFGTAYSGLNYLQRFPVDVLKIDRGFTCRIHECPTAAAICESVLQLAQKLRLDTVAEGVELAEQARMLTEWGCDELQGYYFSHPVPAEIIQQRMTKKD